MVVNFRRRFIVGCMTVGVSMRMIVPAIIDRSMVVTMTVCMIVATILVVNVRSLIEADVCVLGIGILAGEYPCRSP